LRQNEKYTLAKSITKSIERILDSSYGENVSRVIFYAYGVKFGLAKSDVAKHPKEFEETLEAIFGMGTAYEVIQSSICKELENQFQIGIQKKSISDSIRQILSKAE
jgi:hypothetical protein